ncbi:hypothetical protein ASPZODRAFT_127458 [Penicilliopsis zonata CBS 506.65]|uniref:Uncharacterized protein n=1 Tax=Penicilliopsis zonata CBS 506.65 TaxID=1073090 RepID=A0A1L9SW99_9EURO|nr:hypothetical protein ASPZODRAFT_127458 [Penicilliopsis zonata CBS 506.65]OJJ51387.1 hypothetical protein ASPZODRAFT_127458 [Penicilliopsis zonata CBS 506.65]
MVLLVVTAHILSALEAVPPTSRRDLELPSSPSLESPISHDQLIRLARYFSTARKTIPDASLDRDNSLSSLLYGTKVYVPPPPKKPEPTPEYLALKARLLAAADTDAYNCLISSSSSPSYSLSSTTRHGPSPVFASSTPTLSAIHDGGAPHDTDNDPLTPSLVLNIFLSVLITGFSVYWALTKFPTPDLRIFAPRTNTGSSRPGMSEPLRVLLSFLAALAVAVAEVFIYGAYLRKVNTARTREKRLRERKEVIGCDEVGGGRNALVQDTRKEEIWGRGVNGGMRRRVRERWEERERISS